MTFTLEVWDINAQEWIEIGRFDSRAARDYFEYYCRKLTTFIVKDRLINSAQFRTKSWDENNPEYIPSCTTN